MTTPEIIAQLTRLTGRPFLIIGGHAVIACGYARSTVDLDFLISKTDREKWAEALKKMQYEPFHIHGNFEQYRSTRGDIDLDLMLVNEATFEKMIASSKEVPFGATTARIPSLQHLIALKLHVLKQGLRHRMIGDLDDVVQLVLINQIDLDRQEWMEIFQKYGNNELYETVRRAIRIQ